MGESAALQPALAALPKTAQPLSINPRPIDHSAPSIGEDEIQAITRVLRSGHIAQGKEVAAFEEEMAAFTSRRYAVAVSSGTAALELAIRALAIHTIAIPSYACAALLTAAHRAEVRPILCDIGDHFHPAFDRRPDNFDAAILPHLFGSTSPPPKWAHIIDDWAHCLGGTTAHNGHIAIASFYATKLITTGEGGMLLTDNPDIAAFARDQRDYDNRDDYRPRFNYKMTDLQAAMGRVQLTRLPSFILRRREIAAQYAAALSPLPVELPYTPGHIFYRYVIKTSARRNLEEYLNAHKIEAKRPIHKPAHHYQFPKNAPVTQLKNYPHADDAHQTALSLPIHPTLTDAEIKRTTQAIINFFD